MATDYYPRIESDRQLQELRKQISAAANGFMLFANETAANTYFTNNPPAEDVLFKYTDAAASKAEFYRRASDNTTQELAPAALTEADKSEVGPVENGTKVITEDQFFVYKEATDQKFIKNQENTAIYLDDEDNYEVFASGLGRIRTWYFAKSTKQVDVAGVYWYKPLGTGNFTASTRVQIFVDRGGTVTELLTKETPAADMQQFVTEGIVGGFENYEQRIPLDTSWELQPGDIVMTVQVTLASADKVNAIYYDGAQRLDASGEWNDGTNTYRAWSTGFHNGVENGSATSVYASFPEPSVSLLNFYSIEEVEVLPPDLDQRLSLLEENTVAEDISNIVVIPTVVRGLNYDDRTLNFTARIPVEGIFTQALKSARVNNSASAVIDFQTNTDGTTNVSLTLSADNYKTETFTIPFRHSPLYSLQNVMIKLTSIGDSLTQGQVNGSNGNKIAYSVIIDFLVQALNADIGSVTLVNVGTMLGIDTLTQFDRTYTVRACNEGRGGWAISDYLRKFCNTRMLNGTNTFDRVVNKIAWDSLGLGTMTRNGVPGRSYTNLVNNDTNGALIKNTCHGYYEADPTEQLWTWIVEVCGVTSFTYDGTTYTFGETYSTADDEAQKAYILFRCTENVTNPFYDYDTVQSSDGAYAFNYTEYLNKYKTLAADGVTRLEVGSTAGTEVTDINAYDVCEPTHASIIMTENDVNNISDGSLVISDVVLMGERIHAHNPSIKILMGTNRGYGVFNSGLYSQQGYIKETTVNSYRLAAYQALKAELATNTDFDELPLYAIQSPKGTAGAQSYDTFDLDKLDRWNGDGLHAGDVWGYLDRAYQILAWIASTL